MCKANATHIAFVFLIVVAVTGNAFAAGAVKSGTPGSLVMKLALPEASAITAYEPVVVRMELSNNLTSTVQLGDSPDYLMRV